MRIHTTLLSLLALWNSAGTSSLHGEDLRESTDHWVATDALGRTLPGHSETGPRRTGKFVGVFYFVWVGNHTQRVYDISKILQKGESAPKWGCTPLRATRRGSPPEDGIA